MICVSRFVLSNIGDGIGKQLGVEMGRGKDGRFRLVGWEGREGEEERSKNTGSLV